MNACALIVSLGVALAGPASKMDSSISGKVVTKYHQSVVDTKGLFLFSSGDCDGAHKRLVLTKDLRSILINEGAIYAGLTAEEIAERTASQKAQIKPGTIDPKTDRGIRLGMTLAEVQHVLGKPKKSIWSEKFQATELIYTRETPKSADGISTRYSNFYLFRGGKLFYIELAEDMMGGGC